MDNGLKSNVIQRKCMDFSLRIVALSDYLSKRRHQIVSTQILKSGTSIGANVRESRYAQSSADFISKMTIALKEADETDYWLELIWRSNMITEAQFLSVHAGLTEIIKLLISIIKTSKQQLSNNNSQ